MIRQLGNLSRWWGLLWIINELIHYSHENFSLSDTSFTASPASKEITIRHLLTYNIIEILLKQTAGSSGDETGSKFRQLVGAAIDD